MGVPLFDTTMDVYGPNDDEGGYTTLLVAGIACRLISPAGQTVRSRDERDSLAGFRFLVYDAAAEKLAGETQLLIRAERWNVQPGSGTEERGPTGAIAYRMVDVVRMEA